MGKGLWGAVAALALAGCGGAAAPAVSGPVDAGAPDAGEVVESLPPPPSVTFTTDRGTLTGSEAFPLQSAQSIFQGQTADGGQTYAGFQLSDTGQCEPANVDGGAGTSTGQITHVLSGFVRTFDGSAVAPGSYPIGMSSDDHIQTYVEETEFDRQSGNSKTFLATSGHVTIDSIQGGHVEAHLDVTLGDPKAQQELPLSGSFSSDSCSGP